MASFRRRVARFEQASQQHRWTTTRRMASGQFAGHVSMVVAELCCFLLLLLSRLHPTSHAQLGRHSRNEMARTRLAVYWEHPIRSSAVLRIQAIRFPVFQFQPRCGEASCHRAHSRHAHHLPPPMPDTSRKSLLYAPCRCSRRLPHNSKSSQAGGHAARRRYVFALHAHHCMRGRNNADQRSAVPLFLPAGEIQFRLCRGREVWTATLRRLREVLHRPWLRPSIRRRAEEA